MDEKQRPGDAPKDSPAPAPIAKPKKKQIKQLTSIEQAKDRAQITASTAMSIVQVALLKDVIDAGPVGNKYYYWSLGFILTALILQVMSGFIALYIALLRYYYTEYKDDFLDDCCKTCCPFRLRHVTRVPHSIDEWTHKSSSSVHKRKKMNQLDYDSDPETGCCGPYECTTIRYADFEYSILDMYDNMAEQVIKADLQSANLDQELKWLREKVGKLKNELESYETNNISSDKDLQSIKLELQEATVKSEDIDMKNRKAKQLRSKGAVLQHHVEIIQEERVLKRTTFWQNWLNMMLYTVFVLNAGIGLANPQVVTIVGSNPGQGVLANLTIG